MKKVNLGIFLCLLLLGSACQPFGEKEMEKVFKIAGNNRKELQQVITHYSNCTRDSLKRQAALFLLTHLPGHYSNNHISYLAYLDQLDSLYPDMPSPVWKAVSYVRLKDRRIVEIDRLEDATLLRADFLIRHIDENFRKWRKCPWLKDLAFDEFCEYLLPYRFYEEPLRQEVDTILWKKMVTTFSYYPALPVTTENARQMVRSIVRLGDDIYRPRLKLPYSGLYVWDCFDNCFYEVNRMREAGIAATIDYIPAWPTRNGTHCWKVVFDKRYRHDNWHDIEEPVVACIYRRTYSHQPLPCPRNGEYVPDFFRIPFYRNVTSQYVRTIDISLNPKIKGKKRPEYIYLSVFNDMDWRPVAWTPLRNGKALFKEMGYGFIYLPIYYQNQRRINAGYPFLIDGTKRKQELRPDSTRSFDLHITRKFPLAFNKLQWGKDLIDCYFEASNNLKAPVWDTIARIVQPEPDLNYLSFPVITDKAYQYWRIRKNNRILNIGELEFVDEQDQKVKGEIISDRSNNFDRFAFDRDVLTYCRAWSWIGLDLGKQKSLKEIRVISRTDDNAICPGHEYELFYYGENGWVSLGKRKASNGWLDYKNVPGGALYWLHDYSGGKEERIFIVKSGKIVWM